MPRRRVRFVGKRRAGEGEGEWEGEEVTRPRLFRPSAREDPLFGVGWGDGDARRQGVGMRTALRKHSSQTTRWPLAVALVRTSAFSNVQLGHDQYLAPSELV